jgi:hypothetical protein
MSSGSLQRHSGLIVDETPTQSWGKGVQQLSRLMQSEQAHVVLSGPPGSGKNFAAKYVALKDGFSLIRLDVEEPGLQRLGEITSPVSSGVQSLKNLDGGPTLVVINGLEVFPEASRKAALDIAFFKMHRCVAIVNNAFPFKARDVVYFDGISGLGMRQIIQSLPGSSVLTPADFDMLTIVDGKAQGDARRAMVNGEMMIAAKQRSLNIDCSMDGTAHNYFTTDRFLRKYKIASLPPDHLNASWIHANFPKVLTLDDASAFASTMAELDAFGASEELEQDIMHYSGSVFPREFVRGKPEAPKFLGASSAAACRLARRKGKGWFKHLGLQDTERFKGTNAELESLGGRAAKAKAKAKARSASSIDGQPKAKASSRASSSSNGHPKAKARVR